MVQGKRGATSSTSSMMLDALPTEPWASPPAQQPASAAAPKRGRLISPKAVAPATKDKLIGKRSAKVSKISSITTSGAALSRGQRKRLMKKGQFIRRKELGAVAEATHIKIESGTLGDLDDIRLALPTPAPVVKRGPGKPTKKKAQRTLVAEVAQMRAVLTHPLFQSNPLSTIHDHLENSIKLSKVS